MKQLIHIIGYSISVIVFGMLITSCHKDPNAAVEGADDTFTVEFNLQNAHQALHAPRAEVSARRVQAGVAQTTMDVNYLYFWTFNAEALRPDIAIESGASITYNDGLAPESFAVGWPYEHFPAGRALSLTGVESLLIELPIQLVHSLSSFGFDMSSSATGPKAFDLYYSLDDEPWQVLRESNQFVNFTTPHGRNSFIFDLQAIALQNQDIIRFQIRPAAGQRAENSHYNASAGALRIDNVRLRGTAQPPEQQLGDQVRIYAFDRQTGELAGSIIQDYAADMPPLSFALPQGDYKFSFLRHNAEAGLILPAHVVSAENFYLTKPFAHSAGAVYGYEADIYVGADLQQVVTLDRYYSQIRFQFTDARDLSEVARIVVVRLHEPAFFAPFNPELINPILDQTEIEMAPNFALTKEFYFNQFIGRVAQPVALAYHLMAYDAAGNLLRDFEVRTEARHNAQVLLQGELLGPLPFQTSFQIQLNESWDETVEAEF